MKTWRTFVIGAAALAIGFAAARWGIARPSNQPPTVEEWKWTGYLTYLESLKRSKQPSITYRDWITLSAADSLNFSISENLEILESLRKGNTNEAYELLEERVDAEIVGFVGNYRQLPASARGQTTLKVLERARDYRVDHPFKSPQLYPNINAQVAEAFTLLNKKP
jgi:hypothetical protein